MKREGGEREREREGSKNKYSFHTTLYGMNNAN